MLGVEAGKLIAVTFHPEAGLSAAAQEASAGGHALGRGDITVGSPQPAEGKFVQVRSADILLNPLHAKVGPAKIVAKDVNNVRLGRSSSKAVGCEQRERGNWNEQVL